MKPHLHKRPASAVMDPENSAKLHRSCLRCYHLEARPLRPGKPLDLYRDNFSIHCGKHDFAVADDEVDMWCDDFRWI